MPLFTSSKFIVPAGMRSRYWRVSSIKPKGFFCYAGQHKCPWSIGLLPSGRSTPLGLQPSSRRPCGFPPGLVELALEHRPSACVDVASDLIAAEMLGGDGDIGVTGESVQHDAFLRAGCLNDTPGEGYGLLRRVAGAFYARCAVDVAPKAVDFRTCARSPWAHNGRVPVVRPYPLSSAAASAGPATWRSSARRFRSWRTAGLYRPSQHTRRSALSGTAGCRCGEPPRPANNGRGGAV